ncbi:MAG: putative DNA base hypermodification protein [Nitrospirales bacterium]|nr:putative DNA base hypermodification protein [Nitrospirales bacterium]
MKLQSSQNHIRNQEQKRKIKIGNTRFISTTSAYDTYWRFASLRQAIFLRRVQGCAPPWTDDEVLSRYRFTNVYRASDRVSQYLIRRVLYNGEQSPSEVFFRTVLFKLFNRIDTWEKLTEAVGPPSWREFKFDWYATSLDRLLERGDRIYSAAYIMPSPAFGSHRKHRNHLRLIEHMMKDSAPQRLAHVRSLREAYNILRSYPSLGDFLAFQLAIDLNYSELLDFPEMEFVVAGPGARDGISKCFADTGGFTEVDIIRMMSERAEAEFTRLGLEFHTLWGRPLQLVDCQNLFCELSKYARVVHPNIPGESGRMRIKQRFIVKQDPLPQWYPPKWGLTPTLTSVW